MKGEFYKKDLKSEDNLAIAYIRLPEELKSFIDRLPEVHAVEIDGWNMGFAVDFDEAKKRNTMTKLKTGKQITYLIPEKERGK